MLNVGEGVHAAVSQLETDPFSHPTNVKLPTTCTSKERSHPFPIQRGQCLGCHTLFVQETSADAGSEAPASSTASQPVVVLRAVREAKRGFFASGFATLNIKETLPKTNIDPDNGPLEECFPLPTSGFQGPC